MDSSIFMQHLMNAISFGSLYALIAIGYTMVYGILRLINFAHGDIFMMAAYIAVFGVASFHLPWLLVIVMTILITSLAGVLIEKVAYSPLRDAPKMSVMISAIGVSYFLENLATYLFTGRPMSFPSIAFLTKPYTVGSISMMHLNWVTPAVALILLAILLFVINKTKLGMAMRAVSKDYETARLMGIKINRVISATFAIGSALAAVGAILWGMRYPQVQPLMGVTPGLKCFIAAVVGGIGNIKGAVLGGFILGIGEIMLVAILPSLSGYRDAFAFVVLIIILLFMPTGILGEKVAEKV